MLEVKHLSKVYTIEEKIGFLKTKTTQKPAVQDISLLVDKGKIVGLLGINGAGKTTTIKMLSTLLTPSHGEILYDGLPLQEKTRPTIRRKINMITGGERSLYWRLSAKENLTYFAKLYGMDQIPMRVQDCLAVVDLLEAQDQRVEQYSKGMKQRLQIARGLINDPAYIFLDEPTLGLDIQIAHHLRQYIKRLSTKQHKGLILTTHYIHEAEELCDYIYVIDQGKMIAQGTPQTLKELFAPFYTLSFYFDQKDKDHIQKCLKDFGVTVNIDGDKAILQGKNEVLQDVLKALYQNDYAIANVQHASPTLEDSLLAMLEKEKP